MWSASAAARRVAPSRGRGSKQLSRAIQGRNPGRPLTGARIETCHGGRGWRRGVVAPSRGRGSKPLRCDDGNADHGSPPHGGADRNLWRKDHISFLLVAPSRGRGSKHLALDAGLEEVGRPSRGRGSKHLSGLEYDVVPGRPLTGARIETPNSSSSRLKCGVAPSRGRGSKLDGYEAKLHGGKSPPHGGADRNIQSMITDDMVVVSPPLRSVCCDGAASHQLVNRPHFPSPLQELAEGNFSKCLLENLRTRIRLDFSRLG